MFSIEQLRGFVAVAEHLHFGKAAQSLHMTQPPLSRQIQKLEHALQVQLLVRSNRRVELTTAGVVFLTRARQILSLVDQTPRIIGEVARGVEGSLEVGFTSASVSAFISSLVTKFRSEYPGISVRLHEHVSAEQLSQLYNHELDVAFVREVPRKAGLKSHVVHRERLVAAIPASMDALLGYDALSPSQLREVRLIDYSKRDSAYFHEKVHRLFEGNLPQIAFRLTQINSVLAFVSKGSGVGIIPESSALPNIPNVVYRPFREALQLEEAFNIELFAAWNENYINPSLTTFLAGLPSGNTL